MVAPRSASSLGGLVSSRQRGRWREGGAEMCRGGGRGESSWLAYLYLIVMIPLIQEREQDDWKKDRVQAGG